jgi:ribose 5-phosphate isomerase B
MRIAIGADHAGFPLKAPLVEFARAAGHDVEDFGTTSTDPVPYPPIMAAVARSVVDGTADMGVVLGGSGQGEQMAANKVKGARAALCHDLFTTHLARAHNDANIVAMGARIVAPYLATEILRMFLTTPFDGGRHQERVDMIADIEEGRL